MHDFPALAKDSPAAAQEQGAGGCTFSITLYGKAMVAPAEEAERYRKQHLEHNGAESAQFIVGSNIAVVLVTVSSARCHCSISCCDRITSHVLRSAAHYLLLPFLQDL